MNEKMFARYIAEKRDCAEARLVLAVNQGLSRAKMKRLNTGKLCALAAAGVFTLMCCFVVNLGPIKSAAAGYYRSREAVMPGTSEILDMYAKKFVIALKFHLGGK